MDSSTEVERLQRMVERRTRIADLCRDITASRDLQDSVRECARSVLAIFPDLDRASVALADDDGEHVHVHALAGEATIFGVGTRLPLAGTSIDHSLRTGEQVIVRDSDDPARITSEVQKIMALGMRSIAVTAFRIGDRSLGTLNAASRDPDAFDPADRELLAQIAVIVAANLERHRLLAALQTALAASQEREHELQRVRQQQQEIIRAQQLHLEETAAPTIPISDRVIVIPLIGSLDADRARHFVEIAVRGAHEHRAEIVIVDLTGLRRIDEVAGQCLLAAAGAVRLLGARVVLTGMPAALAESLVNLGIDLSALTTSATLQSAVARALTRNR